MNQIEKGNKGKKKNEIVYGQLDAYELEYVLITVADVIIPTPQPHPHPHLFDIKVKFKTNL
jgi:hypothetical protein